MLIFLSNDYLLLGLTFFFFHRLEFEIVMKCQPRDCQANGGQHHIGVNLLMR